MGKERLKIFARGERKLGHIKTQKAERSTQEVQTVHWPKNPIRNSITLECRHRRKDFVEESDAALLRWGWKWRNLSLLKVFLLQFLLFCKMVGICIIISIASGFLESVVFFALVLYLLIVICFENRFIVYPSILAEYYITIQVTPL